MKKTILSICKRSIVLVLVLVMLLSADTVFASETYINTTADTTATDTTTTEALEQTIGVDEPLLVFKASDVKKKARRQNIYAYAYGTLSFKKISGSSKLSITKKTGYVKVKKKTKAGIYKMKVQITAGATGDYKKTKITKTIKVIVAKDKNYVNQYCKAIAKNYAKNGMSVIQKLAAVSSKFTCGDFKYSTKYTSLDKVISTKSGTCWSAGQVLAKVCQKLGYKATLRSAINDKMSRYPSGITFGSDHYNVKVVAKGKTYYIDATPQSYLVYVSSSKKPLYYSIGSWVLIDEE